MPYFAVKDATGATIYLAATGSGSTGDPYVPTHAFTTALPAGSAVIGKVDQGTAGVSAWLIDGSAVTQPVSIAAPVAVTGTFWQATQPISAASLPLPTGASTEATLSTLNGKVPALGQALAAASVPVILPSATITTLTPPAAITGFATSAKQDTQITAEQAILAKLLAAPATEAKQDTGNTSLVSIDTKTPALGQALAAASTPVVLTAIQQTALTPPAAITGFATAAKQPALGTAGTPSSDVITVQGATSGTPLPTQARRSSTATRTNVAGAASSGIILASNANRLGASIYNDSAAILYLDTSGGTATTANYTVQMPANSYVELPFGYTGAITGIWASATGAARVVEYA